LSIADNNIFMNHTKFTEDVLKSIIEQCALGISIKRILKEKDLSWEGFRQVLKKRKGVRENYEIAKADGVSYLLDCGIENIQKTIEDLKFNPNQKSSLAISNLQKEIVGLLRFKATHLLPKYSPKSNISVGNIADKPLVVKWVK